jgi:signal transduction histidine kinase
MRREWHRDVGLTGLVLLAQSGPFVLTNSVEAPDGWPLLSWLPVLGSALPVLLRRRWPAPCLLLSALAVGAYGLLDTAPAQPIWYGALVCMYTVAYQSSTAIRIGSLVVTAAGMVLTIGSVNTAIRELATWSAAFALGALARVRRDAAVAQQRQAAQLATEQERTRIARDLHDILGHAFSLMVVQAEAGAAVAKHDPARAERAFDAISAAGRTAMDQLRTTVGSMREAQRAPQPGLSDMRELVRQVERAGLVARLVELGSPRTLPPQVELAAYRVVQEALTNVVKHARAGAVEIVLDWKEGSFEVSITDDGTGATDPGPVAGTPASGTTGAGKRAGSPGYGSAGSGERAGGTGYGLAGIRERVAAAGGRAEFGQGPAGGFRVQAVFA